MEKFSLSGTDLAKAFDNKINIFSGINFELSNGKAIGITGRNGSGKSTLLKTVSGLTNPTKGKLEFTYNNNKIESENFNDYYGFVSPYLNLYEEFTAIEHIKLFMELKGEEIDEKKTYELLETFNIANTEEKYISKFSSGMKQRIKFILALLFKPPVIFLDEPFTNLDESGIQIVEQIMSEHLNNGGALMIASNDEREIKICSDFINL
jgi:heme exporter protein A